MHNFVDYFEEDEVCDLTSVSFVSPEFRENLDFGVTDEIEILEANNKELIIDFTRTLVYENDDDVEQMCIRDRPKLNEAIKIDNHGEELIIEVSEHIGDNTVRCIAMDTTDGLVRGMEACLLYTSLMQVSKELFIKEAIPMNLVWNY